MKKIVQTLLLTTVLYNTAKAETESKYYIRADTGASKNAQSISIVDDSAVKMKAKSHFLASIGAGYNLYDNFRAELLFSHHFKSKYKSPVIKLSFLDEEAGINYPDLDARVKYNFSASSFLIKGLTNIVDFGNSKIFIEAGAGIALLKGEAHILLIGNGHTIPILKMKSKNSTNPAYSIGTGISFDLTDVAKLDIGYSFTDLGKTKATIDQDGDKIINKQAFRSHNIKTGIRINL